MDALSISSGQGRGEAQVFDASKTFDTFRRSVIEEQQAAKQAKLLMAKQQEQMNKLLADMEKVKVEGYASHLNDLYKLKDEAYAHMVKGFSEKGYSYNPKLDAELNKKLNRLAKGVEISKQHLDYVKNEQQILQKDKDNLDPNSAEAVREFISKDINSLINYYESGNNPPTLTYKPEAVDYIDYFTNKIGAPTKDVSIERPSADGTKTVSVLDIDMPKAKEAAETIYDNALINLDQAPKPVLAYINNLEKELKDDPAYQNLNETQKALYRKTKAVEGIVKIMQMGVNKKYKESLQGGGGGLNFNFGAGFASTDKFNFTYQEDKDGTETVRIARNDASENKPIHIGKGTNRVYGTPVAFVKNPNTKDWKLVLAKVPDKFGMLAAALSNDKNIDFSSVQYIEVPLEEAKDDIKVNYGNFELKEFLEKAVPQKYGANAKRMMPNDLGGSKKANNTNKSGNRPKLVEELNN